MVGVEENGSTPPPAESYEVEDGGEEDVSDEDIIAHIDDETSIDDMDSLMRGGLDDIDAPNEDDL